ncbi:Uncharacterised protein [Vibrio cholerae]|nr:Uncharacterised protein [Vibrio cholerae]CSA34813.1 Uncharacterised protein [Vibrio cholerae]CSC08669.1 Uncharacterised protein [Vibrio cholerae]
MTTLPITKQKMAWIFFTAIKRHKLFWVFQATMTSILKVSEQMVVIYHVCGHILVSTIFKRKQTIQ